MKLFRSFHNSFKFSTATFEVLITLAFRVKFYLLDASFVLGPRICVVNLRRNHGNHSRIFLAFTAAAFFIVARLTATGTRLLRIYNFIFKDSFWNELYFVHFVLFFSFLFLSFFLGPFGLTHAPH